jgi:PAS domain S-box-containing protein
VVAGKVRFIYQHLATALAVNLLISVGLAFSLGQGGQRLPLLLWLGAAFAVVAVRYASLRAYRHESGAPEQLRRWRRNLQGGALAQGLLWGLAGTLLVPTGSPLQVFLLTVLIGMTGGAIIFLAPVWSAYNLFMLPAIVPISLRMLSEAAASYRALGFMGLVYASAMILVSGRTCRWLEDALMGSLERESLDHELREADTALQEYRAQLEATVRTRTQELSEANRRLEDEIAAKEQERLKAFRAETQYRALFDAMSEGFAHVDANEVFVFANPAAEQIYGVPPGTLARRSLSEFLEPAEVEHLRVETNKRIHGEASSYLQQIVRPDGEQRWLQLKVSPVWDDEGKFAGASGVFQDVTDQRRQEEALRQAQKMESLGVLAGGIAHDFNNLLSAIMGNINLVQLETAPEAPSAAYLRSMETSVKRATDLTRQMLAYSGKGHFEVIDLCLNRVITDLADLLQVSLSKGASLAFDLAPELPMVAADPTQIHQVLVNLVSNASEALEGKAGKIRVSTRSHHLDAHAAVRASTILPVKAGPHVVLEVEDTGSGMDPEVQSRIFDPFFTTKESGRGLGLSAMLGILRGHDAGIEIEGRPASGSIFRLFFPVTPVAGATAHPPSAEASHPFSGKVLLVDDEPAILETVAIMLERIGFQVLTARDGAEGLECFQAHAEDIGLVILDLTMPRMDGREAFLAIRRQRNDLPVILTSGYDAQQTLRQLQGPGAPTFLQKPYNLSMLRTTIEATLGIRG